MHLTKEQKEAKEYRNEKIKKDRRSGMSRTDIARKYGISPQCVYTICRYEIQERNVEEPILTEAEQRIKDNIQRTDFDKFHQRDFTVTNLIGALELLITARPTSHQKNYSQIIYR